MAIQIIDGLDVSPEFFTLPRLINLHLVLRSSKGQGERAEFKYSLHHDHDVWFATPSGYSKVIYRSAHIRFAATSVNHRARLVWTQGAQPMYLLMPIRAQVRAIGPPKGPIRQRTKNVQVLP